MLFYQRGKHFSFISLDKIAEELREVQGDVADLEVRVTAAENDISEVKDTVQRQGDDLDNVKNDVNEQGQRLNQVQETVDDTVAKVQEIDGKVVYVHMSAHTHICTCIHLHMHYIRTYLLTYLCPSLLGEHRPFTTPCHHTLFWAALAIPVQLVPCCFSSASVSCFQLLRGQPHFLRALHVVLDVGFLGVCPIRPHFLYSICLASGSCPTRSHRPSFQIFSCHCIL